MTNHKALRLKNGTDIKWVFNMAVAVVGIIGCVAISVVYIIFNKKKIASHYISE